MSQSALSWVSLTSNHDGGSALAQLDGTPAGTLTWVASRMPTLDHAISITGTPYVTTTDANGLVTSTVTLTLPFGGLWYIWWFEGGLPAPAPEAVWLSGSDGMDLDEAGHAVRDALWANKRGIEKAVIDLYPNLTIKSMVYGSATSLREFPAIVISKPDMHFDRIATDWTSLYEYSLSITVVLLHQSEQSEIDTATRIMRAAMTILSSPYYETITLPSGLMVVSCQCAEGSATVVDLGTRYASLASFGWYGQAMKQQTASA